MAEINRDQLMAEYNSWMAVLQGQFDDGSQPTAPSDVARATTESTRLAKLLELDKDDYPFKENKLNTFGRVIDPNAESHLKRSVGKL